MEFLTALTDNAEAFKWIFFIALFWFFYRWIENENQLELWHFISTRSPVDGKHYADIDKLGKVTGVIVGSFAVLRVSSAKNLDLPGFALVLGTYFAFVGGIAGYSAYLRARSGRIETTTTVEPAVPVDVPAKVTTKSSVPAAVIAETSGPANAKPEGAT